MGKIILDKSFMPILLRFFGYRIGKGGYLYEKKTKNRILATDGKPIKAKHVGAINKKGIWRKDLISIIELSDSMSTPGK